MASTKLVPQILRAPFPIRHGLRPSPHLVFLAGLSLTAATQQVAADPAVDLPPPRELPVDFRCFEGEAGLCPLDEGDIFIGDSSKYLEFSAFEIEECGYPPFLTNTVAGIGAQSTCLDDGQAIDSSVEQVLRMDILNFDGEVGFPSSASIDGIYLFPLSSFTGEVGCFPNDAGVVEVFFEDESSATYDYTSDISEIDGVCAVPGVHAIFVDFGAPRQVRRIEVTPSIGNLFASGLDIPDVSPENCVGDGADNTDCEIQIGNPGLDGGDLRAIITDSELVGNVDVVGGPWRVLDPRTHCEPGAGSGDTPTSLVFDTGTSYTYREEDGTVITGPLPLVVSDNSTGMNDFFTIQATSCGVPRDGFTGEPVPRDGSMGGEPYIDIVEIASDIEPTANVLGFESDGLNDTDYRCKPPADADLITQPLIELNVRDDEIKILSGVPGVIDPVGRDITVYCGSKRGRFKQFSFVAWNLLHAIQTDMRSEIDAEIQVLSDSVNRYAACVDSSFYYGSLAPWPYYINLYYDFAVSQALAGNTAQANFYFTQTAALVDLYRSNLELPGVSDNFQRCFATGDKLDMIKDSGVEPVLPDDKPLNAWGDLISQLEHLDYAIRTYIDELSASP